MTNLPFHFILEKTIINLHSFQVCDQNVPFIYWSDQSYENQHSKNPLSSWSSKLPLHHDWNYTIRDNSRWLFGLVPVWLQLILGVLSRNNTIPTPYLPNQLNLRKHLPTINIGVTPLSMPGNFPCDIITTTTLYKLSLRHDWLFQCVTIVTSHWVNSLVSDQ